MRKPNQDNTLEGSPTGPDGQEPVDWVPLSIALPREMKQDFFALARRMHLKPSQYGRMVIADAIDRAKAA